MIDNPIFILACSPRSGSTWLQRVITSTEEVLIWGESTVLYPWGNLWTLDKGNDSKNPHDLFRFRERKAKMWMAVLNPFVSDLQKAHKRYMQELYGETALKEGYKRWGKKETAFSEHTIQFLLSAWPKCKIIFLTRRFDAPFTSRFPQGKEGNFKAQAGTRANDIKIWCEQAISQHKVAYSIDSPQCRVVKYEDLVEDNYKVAKENNIKQLLDWLEIKATYNPIQIEQKISCTNPDGERSYRLKRKDDIEAVAPYLKDILDISSEIEYKLAGGWYE